MKSLLSRVVVALLMCSVSLSAQWPKFRDTSVPRDPQGRARMEAPPPRAANGTPDLSGVWLRADPEPLPSELAGLFSQANRDASGDVAQEVFAKPFPPDPKSPPLAAFWDIETNIPGGLPKTPWAAGVKKERMANEMKDNPDANCMPMGLTQFHMQPQPRKIIQTPKVIVILYESNYGQRTIYTDGRPLPKQGEPQPWWYGYSVGRWEGSTLVVETNNLRGAEDGLFDGWLDVRGTPYSNQAKFIERFRRPTFGKLEIDVTVEDAKAFTKPFTVRINQRVVVDEEPIEFVCNENQQFRQRIKIG
jgi:hypothetical protein